VVRGIEKIDIDEYAKWREIELRMRGVDAGSRGDAVIASLAPPPAFLEISSDDNARASNRPPNNPAFRAESSNHAHISTGNLPRDRSHTRVEPALSFEKWLGGGDSKSRGA
jgi:hypothetical protein